MRVCVSGRKFGGGQMFSGTRQSGPIQRCVFLFLFCVFAFLGCAKQLGREAIASKSKGTIIIQYSLTRVRLYER